MRMHLKNKIGVMEFLQMVKKVFPETNYWFSGSDFILDVSHSTWLDICNEVYLIPLLDDYLHRK